MSRIYHDTPACKTAVIQALRFHFGLKVTEIAVILGIPPQTVSTLTLPENATVLPWFKREHQREAIQAARNLLCRTKLSNLYSPMNQ